MKMENIFFYILELDVETFSWYLNANFGQSNWIKDRYISQCLLASNLHYTTQLLLNWFHLIILWIILQSRLHKTYCTHL